MKEEKEINRLGAEQQFGRNNFVPLYRPIPVPANHNQAH